MGSKSKEDTTSTTKNPLESEDEEQGGEMSQILTSGTSSVMSASLPLILAGAALSIAVVTFAMSPSSSDCVDKADYDALKATVAALQSQSADITVLETNLTSDVASVRRLQSGKQPECKVVDWCAQTGLASLQSQVDGLPTLQTQVDGLAGIIEGGHIQCSDGWGGVGCTSDTRAPDISCESGVVSIQQQRNTLSHTLSAADVPLPTIVDGGPGTAGAISVDLAVLDSSNTATLIKSWARGADDSSRQFDFSTSNVVSESGIATTVDIDTVLIFTFTATDAVGNAATCLVQVHVTDINECEDGTHTCATEAEGGLCENLSTSRGTQSTGTYNCVCAEGFAGDGWQCTSSCVGIPETPAWDATGNAEWQDTSNYNIGTMASNVPIRREDGESAWKIVEIELSDCPGDGIHQTGVATNGWSPGARHTDVTKSVWSSSALAVMSYSNHPMLVAYDGPIHEFQSAWNGNQVVTLEIDMRNEPGTIKWTSSVHTSDYSMATLPGSWSEVYPVVYNANGHCMHKILSVTCKV